MQARTPRPKPPNWTPPPPLLVFVRNLRLLQLDAHRDWPNITLQSLADTSQNQRQRLKAVEWALYHLVTIWDPDTAREKLRPFFPPLEPLQSVNLRAALFRVLSELKKQGDLGREIILRKSMLDDCRGEKCDELLAVFSTAVLRKSLAASSDPRLQNVSINLSLAQGLTVEEYQLLLPLIIAHRVSLNQIETDYDRARETQAKFSELLDLKRRQLAERSTEQPPSIPDDDVDIDALASELRASWRGREQWIDTLLHSGAQSSKDAFLDQSFESAWAKAKESSVDDLTADTTPDLLVDLESRVVRQRARVQHWRQYSAGMQKHNRIDSTASETTQTPLMFNDHQTLTVASISRAVRQPVERASLKAEDRALLFSMTEAIARINGRPATHRRQVSESRPPRDLPVIVPSAPESSIPSPVVEPAQSAQPAPAKKENIPLQQLEDEKSATLEKDPELETARSNRSTLVERTRKSMSLVPPPPQPNPRDRVRSHRPRPSFPVNQFETPRKQPSPSRASTPRDKLFDEEADYASVFKSRPRVAHSPIASPAVHISPIGDFDLDGPGDGDVDVDEMGGGYPDRPPLFSRRR
ncbi:uncharacterized protein BP01DRAFT_392808 [Aspergillus saccharolyticus JOP 1030-1]|uniref:HAUS augmin-like complex subunit 6 N-terminal domain-containing protein n=1 Tax=Aspergillus saccharolyticus JOP 1030-1 TaxID=1450539 RepID=A0A318ZA28_9EURO|nr:hypothetical protein BP01DRAFT_392808 [Aspergillus saccharolyticus JOP 1030-1]PYH44281.1 hypothetical protein BP01DRAFT_392808 [Aspergillus saccharolyticus JOP 1030-1]